MSGNARRTALAAGVAVAVAAGLFGGARAAIADAPSPGTAASPAPTPTEPTVVPGRPGGPPIQAPSPAPSAAPSSAPTGDPVPEPAPTEPVVEPVVPPVDISAVRVAAARATVYPLATGYHDSAVFRLDASGADRHPVAVSGRAVLRRDGRTVRTWRVSGTQPSLRWDGRVNGRVVPGHYRLTVRVHANGRADRTASTEVRISAKHFALGSAAIDAPATARGAASTMPPRAAHAFKYGNVRVRITVDATVRGDAALLFVSRAGTVVLPLRGGVQRTASLAVPDGITRFTVFTRWTPGSVHLHSLRVRWTYRRLVG